MVAPGTAPPMPYMNVVLEAYKRLDIGCGEEQEDDEMAYIDLLGRTLHPFYRLWIPAEEVPEEKDVVAAMYERVPKYVHKTRKRYRSTSMDLAHAWGARDSPIPAYGATSPTHNPTYQRCDSLQPF